MKLKKIYFKLILLSSLIFSCTLFSYAEYPLQKKDFIVYDVTALDVVTSKPEWEEFDINNKIISLDINSINIHNESLYYNVKYFNIPAKENIVITIQNKNNKVGIVSNCSASQYKVNDTCGNPLTPKTAANFKELDTSSNLYDVNIRALELSGYKGNMDFGNADFTSYIKKLNKKIYKEWNPYCNNNKNTIIKFKIAKDGRLLNYEIKKSSGNDIFDNMAINSIKSARTQHGYNYYLFDPLPNDYKGYSVTIEFTFNCK